MSLYDHISTLLTALAIGLPIYLVIFRCRFWFSVLLSWFLQVASQQFAVLASSSIDTTTVGLTLFSGWLLSIPYCGLLMLIRLFLNRIGFLPALTSKWDFLTNGKERQYEQDGTEQLDTHPVVEMEGDGKSQLEAEGCSR